MQPVSELSGSRWLPIFNGIGSKEFPQFHTRSGQIWTGCFADGQGVFIPGIKFGPFAQRTIVLYGKL